MFDFLFGKGNNDAKTAYYDALGQKAQARANQAMLKDIFNSDDEEAKKYLSDLKITPGSLDESVRLADEAVKSADANLNQGQIRFGGGAIDLPGGILGAIFNPAARLAGDVASGVSGKLGEYQNLNQRDTLSSLGDVISLAGNIAIPSTSNVLAGAGIGALSNAGDYLGSTSTENRDFGDLGSSIGLGAAFGGAIPLAQKLGKRAGAAVANRGRNAIASQAMQQGYAPAMANQIARNTSRAAQATAGLGQVMRSKPFKIGAGAVAGGTLLSNLLGSRNANQTGYNDDATYGSDLYGTTEGYNYGTYGY